MQERNLFEKLVDVSPGMEIWWDSSPIIFDNWCKKLLAKADAADRELLQAQFDRMYRPRQAGDAAFQRRYHQPTPLSPGNSGRYSPAGKKRPRKSSPKIQASTRNLFSGNSTFRLSNWVRICTCPCLKNPVTPKVFFRVR